MYYFLKPGNSPIHWLAENNSGWLAENRSSWLAENKSSWLAENKSGWLAEKKSGWLTGNKSGLRLRALSQSYFSLLIRVKCKGRK